MKQVAFVIVTFLFWLQATAQQFIPLWPVGKKPNDNGTHVKDSIVNERIYTVSTPGIYSFLVPSAENTGTSILICPGGGYERVSYIYNGFNFAHWFNTLGINVFVLVYRLPHQADLKVRELAPLQDAQRAMKIIRSHTIDWKINPSKLGVMGISAGGHVAGMLGTHCEDETNLHDGLDTVSTVPNFMVLLSPVVTMGKYAHPGSRKNFLGGDTTAAMIKRYSNEEQVSACTPPAFLIHAYNDKTVNVHNSLLLYNALVDKNVNASIHVFPQGGHGIRLDENPGSTDLWTSLLEKWLKEMNLLTPIPFK